MATVNYGEPVQKLRWDKRFFSAFNTGFTAMTDKYMRSISFLFKHRWLTMGGLAVITAATVWMLRTTPTGFIPNEDQGFVFSITMPDSSPWHCEVAQKVERCDEGNWNQLNDYLSVAGMNIVSSSISSN